MTPHIDEYELKARTAPGLILATPVLAAMVFAVPQIAGWKMFTATGIVGAALVYGVGRLAQALGEAIEPELWKKWNGPPSTRFLRFQDPTFGEGLKASVRAATESTFNSRMPTHAEEQADLRRADQLIFDAFRQVRNYLRRNDPKGLWHRHNAEYGFCRNLLGCRGVWTTVAALTTVLSLICAAYRHTPLMNPGSVIAGLSLISAIYMGWSVLPAATKRAADNYAESAWIAFLHLGKPGSRGEAKTVKKAQKPEQKKVALE